MPKSSSEIELSKNNLNNFSTNSTNNNIYNLKQNKLIMSPPVNHNNYQYAVDSDFKSGNFLNRINQNQRFNNPYETDSLKSYNNPNRNDMEQHNNPNNNQRQRNNMFISDMQNNNSLNNFNQQQSQQQQQQNRFNLMNSNQQQQSNNLPQNEHHHQQQLLSNNNYLDANNNNNNNLLFNKTLNNLAATQQQLNNSIGGVINNLINSTLSHSANTAFLLNNSNTISAATAASANLILTAASNAVNFTANSLNNSLNNPNYVDESKCHVCGDKSTGSHFGGISCESCKAFFRRSVQRNRFEDYKCSYSGECKMNTNTRKICQFCRYKRCLAIGMRPKWVLSDDERHQKYGSRRKNKNKPDESKTEEASDDSKLLANSNSKTSLDSLDVNSKSSNDLKKLEQDSASSKADTKSASSKDEQSSSAANSENDSSTQTPKESSDPNDSGAKVEKNGIDCIEMNNLNLNSYEKDLIDRLSIAFYHSRKYNSVDLNVQKKLAVLFQTQNEGSLKKMSKVILANFIVQPVKRVITFAKLLPDFRKLDINDQMSLLQGGSMEIFICSSSSLYDQMANKFVNIVSKDRNIEGNDSSNIQLDMLRLIWSEDIFDKTIGFLKSMSEFHLDEATLILFLPLILFSPDRRDLKDRQTIYKIQSKYSFILKKYMIWKYGLNASTIKLYNKLLLKLLELRTLHEMHSSILLDADPSQLEPFSLALLSSQKDELSKYKSNESGQNREANSTETTPPRETSPLSTTTTQTLNSTPSTNLNSSNKQKIIESDSSTDSTEVLEESEENNNRSSSSNSNVDLTNMKPNSNCYNSFSDMNILTPASSGYSGQLSSISSVSSPNTNQSPYSNELNNNNSY